MRGTAFIGIIALSMVGCGGEDIYYDPAGGGGGRFSTASRLDAYLDGKTLLMDQDSIPSHPNGYDEHTNFGQATQCYHKVTMTPLAGRYRVVSLLGTLQNAPNNGDRGTCDRTTMSSELPFDSTAAIITDVRGDGACFDFTITYAGFGQEGRGSIDPAGKVLTLELFFKDQAIGHRCADGNVGDRTVTLSQAMFTGDARQRYNIQE